MKTRRIARQSKWKKRQLLRGCISTLSVFAFLCSLVLSLLYTPKSLVQESMRQLSIPRLIHVTVRSRTRLTLKQRAILSTWRTLNPSWKLIIHDDFDCRKLFENHYPSYLQAYDALPKNVERADFFRYAVVHHYGGLYVDSDVECRMPIEQWIGDRVRLIIGIENNFHFPSVATATLRGYARTLQYQQWAFFADKNHPLLRDVLHTLKTKINDEKKTGFDLSQRGTLERTGPGLWTDCISEFLRRTFSQMNNLTTTTRLLSDEIWILPQIHSGAFPNGFDGIDPRDEQVYLLHHFSGDWKPKGKLKLKHKRLISPQFQSAVRTSVTSFGHPVSIILPKIRAEREVISNPERLTVFLGEDETSRYNEFAALLKWGHWHGIPLQDDFAQFPFESSIPNFLAGIESEKRELVRFVEIGSESGVYSLMFAKRQITSLSIALNDPAIERIQLAAQVSGCSQYHSVKDMDENYLEHIHRFLIGQTSGLFKAVFHLQGHRCLEELEALMSSNLLAKAVRISALVPLDQFMDIVRLTESDEFSRLNMHAQYVGVICRRAKLADKKKDWMRIFNIKFLLVRTARRHKRRRLIGVDASLDGTPTLYEPVCDLSKAGTSFNALHTALDKALAETPTCTRPYELVTFTRTGS